MGRKSVPDRWREILALADAAGGEIRAPNGLTKHLGARFGVGHIRVSVLLKRLEEAGCIELLWSTIPSTGMGSLICGLKILRRDISENLEAKSSPPFEKSAVPVCVAPPVPISPPAPVASTVVPLQASSVLPPPSDAFPQTHPRTKSEGRRRVVLLVDALNAELSLEGGKFPFESLREYVERNCGMVIFADAFVPLNYGIERLKLLWAAGFDVVGCPFEHRETGDGKTKDKDTADVRLLERARKYIDLAGTDVVVLVSGDADIVYNDAIRWTAKSMGTELLTLKPKKLLQWFGGKRPELASGPPAPPVVPRVSSFVVQPHDAGILRASGPSLNGDGEIGRVFDFLAQGLTPTEWRTKDAVAFVRRALLALRKGLPGASSGSVIESTINTGLAEWFRKGNSGAFTTVQVVSMAIKRGVLEPVTLPPLTPTYKLNEHHKIMAQI